MAFAVCSSRARYRTSVVLLVSVVTSGILPATAFSRPAEAGTAWESAPAAPVVESQAYPSGTFGGGPDVPGDFTFTVTNSPSAVDHYVWRLDNDVSPSCDGVEPGTVKPAEVNGPATATITPASSGSHLLSAWSCNLERTPSARTGYYFSVKDAARPVAAWQFEGDGTSQVTGLRYAGAGTEPYTGGKLGDAAVFVGHPDTYLATSARVLDTAESFSVSAWVNPADLSGTEAVLSQDGNQSSAFALQYQESGRWAFSLGDADVASPLTTSAVSAVTPVTGVWTHLTAVYDATAHTASLYVDGAAQSTVSATAWGSTGPLVVGAAKSGGFRNSLFDGAVDEAAVFDRALSSTEVSTLFGQNGVPAGFSAIREYTMDGSLRDATGTDGGLVLGGGAAFGPGFSNSSGQSATDDTIGSAAGQAWTGSGSGYARTAGPVIDTTRSFTVSAWAKVTENSGHQAIAAQEGAHSSGFELSASPTAWAMGMPTTDADGDTYRWAFSTTAPQVGVWTHLTGVYDSDAGKVLLYVNGILAGQAAIPAGSVFTATGAFDVGTSRLDGTQSAFFQGSLDQVQVWGRPLRAPEIAGLANTAVLRANYQLDGSTTDGISGLDGALSGAAAMTTDADGANVARFGSTGGQIEGVRPQNLRTDGSFTVSAWVRHTWTEADATAASQADPANTNGVDEGRRTAVGVNSPRSSPFLLGYQGQLDADGVWRSSWSWTLSPDATSESSMTVSDFESNVWTHLTGTYDAITHTACVYVTIDGLRSSPVCSAGVTGWNGTGDLEDLLIGRGRGDGVDFDFHGDIRGVRVYTGVLDSQHIEVNTVIDHP
jgi:hypothetical protein